MKLQFGSQVVRSYKRLSYTPWHAFAEFVDNSTQAFENHSDELLTHAGDTRPALKVEITYEPSDDVIVVRDNSIGMDLETLEKAMTVGLPPKNKSGRSRYGLGLKTAAFWLGDLWSVTTSRLGSAEEHTVTVDVDQVASGQDSLPVSTKKVDTGVHYTVVRIERLNRRFRGKTLSKIRDFLRSMYRVDLRERRLELLWRGESLRWEDSEHAFLLDGNGNPYKRDFRIDVEGRPVDGWAGVLAKGGRSIAGFSILHAGRVVRGWPNSWRPQEIYGQIEGSNDLVNQRLVGEINLDAFDVTHTKDDVLWFDDDRMKVERALREALKPLIVVAKTARVRSQEGPTRAVARRVAKQLKTGLSKDISAPTAASEGVILAARVKAGREIANGHSLLNPDITATVGDRSIAVYLAEDESADALYASTSVDDNQLTVVVSLRHPFASGITSSEALQVYVMLLAIEALAEQRPDKTLPRSGYVDALLRELREWGVWGRT